MSPSPASIPPPSRTSSGSSARFEIVVAGNVAKFGQNPALAKLLLDTGDRVLVEAAPRDRIWGIGMGGGYSLAFNITGHTPQALQGAPGYWAAAAFGQCVAGLVLTWLMAHALATAVRSAPRPAEANAV